MNDIQTFRELVKGQNPPTEGTIKETTRKVEEAIRLLESLDFEGPLRGVESRLMDIQTKLTQATLNAVQAGLKDVVSSRKQTDLSPVLSGIGSIPKTDLAPVLKAIEAIDLTPVIDAVKGIKMPTLDLTEALIAIVGLRQDIQAIEMPRPVDLSGIEKRLAALEKPKEYEFTIERINSMPASPIKKVTAKVK